MAQRLSIAEEYLVEIAQLLEAKRQVVFYGPPGTGKTYVAKELAAVLAGDRSRVRIVQFHASYAYEDFVEGYRPRLHDGVPGFELVPGPLKQLAAQARDDPGHLHFLIIDEMNRGNVAKVLGELYFLLEYRDEEVVLQYSPDLFSLPENLRIIGTMNTADRSIAVLDAALRRRFAFIPFFPDQEPIAGLLRRWLSHNQAGMEWIADVVDAANRKLQDRNGAIGPSFFLDQPSTMHLWHSSGSTRSCRTSRITSSMLPNASWSSTCRDSRPSRLRRTLPRSRARKRSTILQPITLSEYGTAPGVQLTQAQLHRLRTLAPSISVAPSAEVTDCYDLTPGSLIGTIDLGDLQLIVRPKLPIQRVMFLVSYAVSQGRWASDPVPLATDAGVLEATIPAFAFHLRRALARGVLQGYRHVEEPANTVRGRWRIGDQIRTRYGIAPPIEVEYDDFTDDIEANRILRAGIHRLLHVRVRSDQRRWGLRSIDTSLAGVRLVTYDPRRVPTIRYDQRTERYRPAVELARLILRSCSLEVQGGETPASAFLVDMNRVFEEFVVIALGEAFRGDIGRLVQGNSLRGLYLDERDRVVLRPDISVWRAGKCIFVGDVKYKRLHLGSYPNADLYQLLAYATATGLRSGLLIYAAGEEAPEVHEVVNGGIRLQTLAVDLDQEPDQVLGQINSLAEHIRRLAA